MDHINIIILNQWNLDLNSTMEKYGTADDSTPGDLAFDFNSNLKRRGLAIAMTIWLLLNTKFCTEVLVVTVIFTKIIWFWFWSTIAKIFLKLVGFAGIGLIFGRGYAFVNLTIFRWTDEIGIDLKTLAYGTAALTLVNIKELLKELMVEYQELIIELREARN
mgnify:CR=1 FL=1